MIVERADTFGLSQLHQLRGRVGRSRERGYAYFLYPPQVPLTETAYDRLATIAQNNELGAGMAGRRLKDLEIAVQQRARHPTVRTYVAGVGFDLYVRLVSEATWRRTGTRTGRPPTANREDFEELKILRRSTCPLTRTCHRTTSPVIGCGWRATGGTAYLL